MPNRKVIVILKMSCVICLKGGCEKLWNGVDRLAQTQFTGLTLMNPETYGPGPSIFFPIFHSRFSLLSVSLSQSATTSLLTDRRRLLRSSSGLNIISGASSIELSIFLSAVTSSIPSLFSFL
jgi:hypothetical protein